MRPKREVSVDFSKVSASAARHQTIRPAYVLRGMTKSDHCRSPTYIAQPTQLLGMIPHLYVGILIIPFEERRRSINYYEVDIAEYFNLTLYSWQVIFKTFDLLDHQEITRVEIELQLFSHADHSHLDISRVLGGNVDNSTVFNLVRTKHST